MPPENAVQRVRRHHRLRARGAQRLKWVARDQRVWGDRRETKSKPFALGGPTTVDNLQLRCRAHNAYEAEMDFGAFVLREEEAGYLPHSTASGPS